MNDEQRTGTHAAKSVEGDRDQLTDALANLTGVIGKYNDVIGTDSSTRQLLEISKSVTEDTKEMMEEGRLLRLGIVGQVKAGKSSLLNLLLFDGQEVLPKAATPMTASLTHIVKSNRDEVEVEYYSERDWKEIERHAREYERIKSQPLQDGGRIGMERFLEASHQLVEMAHARGIRVHEHLGNTRLVPVPTSKLNEELPRFVGADGELTPLVKSVTIRSSQGMPDLDIVDTPGINDPVRSRSQQAERLLARCDAVLLLSPASQFMDSVDVEFFEKKVAQEGISHRLVLGSKFDSALLDVARDYGGRFAQAKEDTERKLEQEAIAKLDDPSDIVFVSAMCAALAQKPVDAWATDEKHTFYRLHEEYEDFFALPDGDGVNEATRQILNWLGNREAVDASLSKVRTKKDGIIARKMADFLQEKHKQANEELNELVASLEERRKSVEKGDVHAIESQQRAVGELGQRLETEAVSVWERQVEGQGKHLDELELKVREEIKEARGEIKGAVRTERRTKKKKKKGLVNAIKRAFGADGGWEKRTYDKKVLDRGALETAIDEFLEDVEFRVGQVVDKMYSRSFARRAESALHRVVAEQFPNDVAANVDLPATKRAVREAVRHIVEEAQKSLRNTRKSLLESMDSKSSSVAADDQGPAVGTVPTYMSLVDAIANFSGFDAGGDGSVKNQEEARKLVKRVGDLVNAWLYSRKEDIDAVAKKAQADLVPATIGELRNYQERLKREIQQKEFVLQRYRLALAELARIREHLQSH